MSSFYADRPDPLFDRVEKLDSKFFTGFREYVLQEFSCNLSMFFEDVLTYPYNEDAHEDDDYWMMMSEAYGDPVDAVNDLFYAAESARKKSKQGLFMRS